MVAYFVGDTPAVLTFDVPDYLDDFTSAEVEVEGMTFASVDYDAEDGVVTATPNAAWEDEGLHAVSVRLIRADETWVTFTDAPIVVETLGPWHTLDTARASWSTSLDDATLYSLLSNARVAILAFAPALDDDDVPPLRYVRAQLMHARNMLNAARVNPSGDIGEGEFYIQPRPLDWHVKALLRPQRGRPLVG